MKRIFLTLLLLLPTAAQAYCERLWDVSALVKIHATEVTLESRNQPRVEIPTQWLRGIDIVSKKIDAASGTSTKLHLCNAKEPNAFAWMESGPNIALTVGMYRLLGNDWHAYAALFGHENTHLVKKHGQKRQTREVGLHFSQGMLGSILSRNLGASGAAVSQITALGISALGASYSRNEEHEADKYGAIYAHCAGFSPEGALRLQRKLNSASSFLSSHPSSRQRIAALNSVISGQQHNPNCN